MPLYCRWRSLLIIGMYPRSSSVNILEWLKVETAYQVKLKLPAKIITLTLDCNPLFLKRDLIPATMSFRLILWVISLILSIFWSSLMESLLWINTSNFILGFIWTDIFYFIHNSSMSSLMNKEQNFRGDCVHRYRVFTWKDAGIKSIPNLVCLKYSPMQSVYSDAVFFFDWVDDKYQYSCLHKDLLDCTGVLLVPQMWNI